MTPYAQAGTMLHPAAELRNASSTTPYRAAGRCGLPRSLASDAALSPRSSSPGESHPQALTEPSGRLSTHLARTIQPQELFRFAKPQTDSDYSAQSSPSSGRPCADAYEDS